MVFRVTTASVKGTQRHARFVAKKLRGGEVLCLSGNLGSGKTTWVQGLARALGIQRTIKSPTFTLVQRYPVRGHKTVRWLYHLDLYRLETKSQKKVVEVIRSLGLEEFVGQSDTITVIEWAEKLGSLLPPTATTIRFQVVDERRRSLVIKRPAPPRLSV